MINLNATLAGRRAIAKAKKVFKEEASKVSKGSLSKDVKVKLTSRGLQISFKEYGKYIDRGRKPGTPPPVAPIERWVKRKNINIKGSSRSTAFAISKSIGKKGIPARPWLDKANERVMNEVGGELTKAMAIQMLQELQITNKPTR